MTSSLTLAVTETKEGMNDLGFVDNILDVTSETVPQDEVESLDSDDKFNIEVGSVSKVQNWPFRPLSESFQAESWPIWSK